MNKNNNVKNLILGYNKTSQTKHTIAIIVNFQIGNHISFTNYSCLLLTKLNKLN